MTGLLLPSGLSSVGLPLAVPCHRTQKKQSRATSSYQGISSGATSVFHTDLSTMHGVSLAKESSLSPDTDVGSEEHFERPRGLKGVYYHPITQLIMLGFVCFLCPGMFNALTGLGGGGQMNATTSANSTCALYSTYAFFAFFSG